MYCSICHGYIAKHGSSEDYHPSTLAVIACTHCLLCFSFAALTPALKRIDLSFAYAVWAVLGVLLTATMGIVYFKEPISALKIIWMVFIVVSLVGLHARGIAY